MEFIWAKRRINIGMKTDDDPKVLLIENNKTDSFILKWVWQKVKPLEDLVIFGSIERAIQFLSDDDNKRSITYIFFRF